MNQNQLSPKVKSKYQELKTNLSRYPNLLVAYSGGVDSTLLLKIAVDVLGRRALGVIGISPSLAGDELIDAEEFAKQFGLPYVKIETHEMENEQYASNPMDRCYFCKKELFTEMFEYARKEGYHHIADGTNLDDVGDYRPGHQAAAELSVVSPLKEASLSKKEVRELSQYLGLPTWDKPALACLASRFPTGTRITFPALEQVEKAERFLRNNGFRIIRVRHHDNLARIEVGSPEIRRFLDDSLREKVVQYFKQIGYQFVTVDLRGYRQGSANQPAVNDKRTEP